MQKIDFRRSAVVYQISLRSFTRDGTFRAAAAMLPHIKGAGVDIVYLTPFFTMDTDMDRSGWSPRQIKAGFDTPKNPYRIGDYTSVDHEYGNWDDAAFFVAQAHALGLLVVFDLVYLHCGPNNVIKDAIPDAFQKNEDGTIRTTIWNFPYLNFESAAVREYLYANMAFFVCKIDCDGFRCDVGDQVPLDFWAEGFRRMKAVKPDFFTINEGCKPEYLNVFDSNYGWTWSFGVREVCFGRKTIAELLAEQRDYAAKCPENSRDLMFIENHDISTDDWENRFDRILPVEAGNAMFAAIYLQRGIPVLYNGNEIADNSMMTFFGPVEDPRRAAKTVDWGRALQADGQKRLNLLRELSELRRTVPELMDGSVEYPEWNLPEGVLAFLRKTATGKMLVVIQLHGEKCDISLPYDIRQIVFAENVNQKSANALELGEYGFCLLKI